METPSVLIDGQMNKKKCVWSSPCGKHCLCGGTGSIPVPVQWGKNAATPAAQTPYLAQEIPYAANAAETEGKKLKKRKYACVYVYSGILFSCKIEGNPVICHNKDRPDSIMLSELIQSEKDKLPH